MYHYCYNPASICGTPDLQKQKEYGEANLAELKRILRERGVYEQYATDYDAMLHRLRKAWTGQLQLQMAFRALMPWGGSAAAGVYAEEAGVVSAVSHTTRPGKNTFML